MSESETELENTAPIEEAAPVEEAPKKETKTYSREEVEDLIKARLKNVHDKNEKREAELRAQYEQELANRKTAAPPVAPVDNTVPPQAGAPIPNGAGAPPQESIPVDMLPHYVEMKKKADAFKKGIDDAVEEDPEFKKLLQTGNRLEPVVLQNMIHLQNAPQVVKHLLKDSNDYEAMDAAAQSGRFEFVKFINELSDKLKKNTNKPAPSEFKPAPNIDADSTPGEDFDLEEYIKNKRV